MKLKALAAIAVAGIMVMSVPMVAMAGTHEHASAQDGHPKTDYTEGINATSGTCNAGDVGSSTLDGNAIKAQSGATVTADSATNTSYFNSNATVEATGTGTTVTIKADETTGATGAVTNNGNNYAINAYSGAIVTAGSATNGVASQQADKTIYANDTGTIVIIKADEATGATGAVTNNGDGTAIWACEDATVTAGSAKNNGISATVYANDNGTIEIKGAVTNNGIGKAIEASNGAKVTADSATNRGPNVATPTLDVDNATVTVTGAVTNNGLGSAIDASNGATVTAGSATNGVANKSSYETVLAEGDNTTVVITDSVTNNGIGYAISVDNGATVVVEGTAEANTTPVIINDDTSKVIVYEIKSNVGGNMIGGTASKPNDCVYYIIKGTDSAEFTKVNGTTTQTIADKSYNTAKYNDVITISVASGYEVKAGTIEVTQNADGTYSVTVPYGGGVTLEAILKSLPTPVQPTNQSSTGSAWTSAPTSYGSSSAPVSNGSWSNVNGKSRYTINGELVRNAIAVIQYQAADGQTYTGTFYFDRNGDMATGWQKIDGVWYYFNEAAGSTQGMMLVNATTPDGYKVGADGKWIQ